MNRFLKYSGILQQQAHQVGGGEAVAPEVISVSPSIIASGTNHNVSLPATLSSGDLVLIWAILRRPELRRNKPHCFLGGLEITLLGKGKCGEGCLLLSRPNGLEGCPNR